MKRQRGRGRKNNNQTNRHFDSNGPDVKIRGSASHIYEKYQQLARDATSSGDRVMAENYLQHAEHYFRIVQSAPKPVQSRDFAPNQDRDGGASDDTGSNGTDADSDISEREADGMEVVQVEGTEDTGGNGGEGNDEGGRRPRRTRRPRNAPNRETQAAQDELQPTDTDGRDPATTV